MCAAPRGWCPRRHRHPPSYPPGRRLGRALLVHRWRSAEIVQYAAVLVWRSTRMLSEEAREITLRAEAKRIRNGADPVMVLVQAADGRFDAQRVEVEPRTEAGADAEQVVEMRARQAGDARDAVEIKRGSGVVAHVAQRAADAEISWRRPRKGAAEGTPLGKPVGY